jgi:hypothetical protein
LKVKMEQLFTQFAAHVAQQYDYDFPCGTTLQHKFAAAATITNIEQASKKCINPLSDGSLQNSCHPASGKSATVSKAEREKKGYGRI